MMSTSAGDVDFSEGSGRQVRVHSSRSGRGGHGSRNSLAASESGGGDDGFTPHRKVNARKKYQQNDSNLHVEYPAEDASTRTDEEAHRQSRRGRGGKYNHRAGRRRSTDYQKNMPSRREKDVEEVPHEKEITEPAKSQPPLVESDFKPPLSLEEIKKMKKQKLGSADPESGDGGQNRMLSEELDDIPPPPPPPPPPLPAEKEAFSIISDGSSYFYEDTRYSQTKQVDSRKEPAEVKPTTTGGYADIHEEKEEASLPVRRFDPQDDEVAYSDSDMEGNEKEEPARFSNSASSKKDDKIEEDYDRSSSSRASRGREAQIDGSRTRAMAGSRSDRSDDEDLSGKPRSSGRYSEDVDSRKPREESSHFQKRIDSRENGMDWSSASNDKVGWPSNAETMPQDKPQEVKTTTSERQSKHSRWDATRSSEKFDDDGRENWPKTTGSINGTTDTPVGKVTKSSDTPLREGRNRGRSPPRRRRSVEGIDRPPSRTHHSESRMDDRRQVDPNDRDLKPAEEGRRFNANSQVRRPQSPSPPRFRNTNREDRQESSWSHNQRRKREADEETDERESKRVRDDGNDARRGGRLNKGPTRNETRMPLEHKAVLDLLDSETQLVKALTKLHEVAKADLISCVELTRSVLNAAVRAKKVFVAEEAFNILREALLVRNGTRPSLDDLMGLMMVFIANGMIDKVKAFLLGPDAPILTISELSALWKTPLLTKGCNPAVMSVLCGLVLKATFSGGAGEEKFINLAMSDLLASSMTDTIDSLFHMVVGIVPPVSESSSRMRQGSIFNRVLLQGISDHFIAFRRFASAFDVFRHMFATGTPFNESSLLRLYRGAQNDLDSDLVWDIFKAIQLKVPASCVDAAFYEEALDVNVRYGRVDIVLAIVEYMGQTKIKPRSWDSMVPVLRLAESWNLLEKFVLALNNFFVDGNETIEVDVHPAFISELIAYCVAHNLHAHAFWYHKYMMHSNLRRTGADYSNLLLALAADPKCAMDAVFLYNDAKQNRYVPKAEEAIILIEALYTARTLDAMKAAAEVVENRSVREKWPRPSNPSALFEVLLFADRCSEALEIFDEYSRPNGDWPENLPEDMLARFILHTCGMKRFDAADRMVQLLRTKGTMKPSREFIHRTIHIIEGINPQDFKMLAIRVFAWGVEKSVCGLLRPRELSLGRIHAEDCWSPYEVKLHMVRCMEWLRLANPSGFNRDIKIFLPLFFSEGGSRRRVVGLNVATEMVAYFKTEVDPPLEFEVTSERDNKDHRIILANGKAVFKWMEHVFGFGPNMGSPFSCMPEVKDKSFESGSLEFGVWPPFDRENDRETRDGSQDHSEKRKYDHYPGTRSRERDDRDDSRGWERKRFTPEGVEANTAEWRGPSENMSDERRGPVSRENFSERRSDYNTNHRQSHRRDDDFTRNR
ncbi:hypothetical protein HDU67_006658 [Dinochytrium kinnereticum]|nr:hypothetical protein HDU67_006658 [Dinochytrium kinnereticum]